MHHENLTESDRDYIDNMDLNEAIEVFSAYIHGGWIKGNKEDEKAFEIILKFLRNPEKHCPVCQLKKEVNRSIVR